MERMEKLSEVREDLDSKVRLTISLIGVGNAGNQVAVRAHKAGYRVFAINSSLRDLNDAVVDENIPSFIAGTEARGAGKNRALAKKLFKSNGKTLFGTPQFSGMVESSDIVFVVGSTAGGTGSAICPELMNILSQMYPQKIIIYYGILPKESDSVQAQYNTLDCLTEISEAKHTYMLADLSYYEAESNDVAYEGIGNHIIESINVIAGKYINQSKSGIIDENDMRAIISESGYMSAYILNKVTQKQVDQASIQSYMIKQVKNSPAADINRDGIVKQMGVIVNCPEEMAEATKTGDYKELQSYIGTPFSVFENYSTNNSTMGQFIILLSGMSLPYSRLLKCKEVIKEAEEILKRQKEIKLSDDLNEFDFLKRAGASSRLLSETEETEETKAAVLNSFFD